MKTFEEIFYSIEKEEKKREVMKKQKNELITAYAFFDNFRKSIQTVEDANAYIEENKIKEAIPYVNILCDNNALCNIIAQSLRKLLDTIPYLSQKEIDIFKEIGVLRQYQPLKKIGYCYDVETEPEIINIRLFSNINDEVILRLKYLFYINDDTGNHWHRKFSYHIENDVYYLNMVRSWELHRN